ncbi:MAG: hypothetical protein RL685_6794 [Pseudomonadota bacterium]|jgi:uncharacterized membrane protein YtjA (UPF0391 family)
MVGFFTQFLRSSAGWHDTCSSGYGDRVYCAAHPSFISGGTMLHWAAVFLVIALVAALFGFGGIAAGAAGIAKVLFVLFIILALVAFVVGRRAPI